MTPMEQSARKGLVERLRHAANEDIYTVDEVDRDKVSIMLLEAATALSSDARPTPMAEVVANAAARLRNLIYGDAGKSDLDIVSAHIDDLTRKVAEAERDRDRARNTLSLHAGDVMSLDNEVLAMREQRDEAEARLAVLSRPSPGPATETDRGNVADAFGAAVRRLDALPDAEFVAAVAGSGMGGPISALLCRRLSALLASVRPKEEK